MDQEGSVLERRIQAAQDLTVIPTDIRLAVFTTPGAIEPWLDHVRKSVADFKPDTSTARGRQNIKSIAFEVTKSKTYLTKVGKELADEQKAIPKLIDATRKHITETLEALAVSVRQPLTDWEQEDEQRVQAHRNAISNFAFLSEAKLGGVGADLTAADLKENLALIEAMPVDAEHCEEFLSEYERAKQAALAIMSVLVPLREKAEADAAELIQLRAAAAARDERDRFEADMLEKAAAEKARAEQAAVRKAEDDRLAAEREAQREIERVDREARLVAEAEARVLREAEEAKAREAAEAERRENDRQHRYAIKSAAIEAFHDAGFNRQDATKIVELIATKAIPAISIAY